MRLCNWFAGIDINSHNMIATFGSSTGDERPRVHGTVAFDLPSGSVTALHRPVHQLAEWLRLESGGNLDAVALSVPGNAIQEMPSAGECRFVESTLIDIELVEAARRKALHGPDMLGLVLCSAIRSYEYDGLGDAYARFVLDELLPAVESKSTGDGRPIHLSQSGNDRSIGGQSSGGIAAFTAAWERPEAFSRVFSAIGSYPDLRGGMRYPGLIRKVEPKPIRVFLQDGENDQNIYAGDWWMANQLMERALVYAGYEVNHVWGHGTHSGNHAAAIFPEAIRWLWKDWPRPVQAGQLPLERIGPLFIPGEAWELVGQGYKATEGAAVNAQGEVFFNDMSDNKTFKVGLDGQVTLFNGDSKKANGEAFDPQGRLLSVSMKDPRVLRHEADGTLTVLAEGIAGNDIVVAHNGDIYLTNPPPDSSNEASKLWLIRPDGTRQVVDTGAVKYMNGVTLSPDQSLLYVDDYRSHWIYAYSVQPDGTLANKQRFDWLNVADSDDQSNADGLRCDRDGLLYVATRLGIQICDQTGKVQCIVPTPNRRVSNLVFGGAHFDTLYATCGDKVFRRKLHKTGANAWDAPNKPPKPHL